MNTALQELVREKLSLLSESGIESSAFELKMLLSHILNCEPFELYSYSGDLTPEEKNLFETMIKQRLQHCPVDKIIGHKGFYKYEFVVSQDVLSPRADSEVLVENALKLLRPVKNAKILEFGIGSGCLLLSVLADKPNAYGIGVDISQQALEIALKNAKNLGVSSRVKLFHASWFDEEEILNNAELVDLDLIISNPPYIASAEIGSLAEEVKNFDPLIALDGGNDGLRDYRQISKIAFNLLKKDGYLIFEIGENQENDVIKIATDFGFKLYGVERDLNQINRCIILKK
ncbi:MAG: peptide chain release factor N(5)-glutamine methyltransferase [Alphaproteobacteria bacterium]|nr:peptide chain release factor N(5)-glutamine methyltransferase [Alphaproteobacteria bacterium]